MASSPIVKEWLCYILYLDHPTRSLTYVGVTVNFDRRLRQHNGGLIGGALYTSMNRKIDNGIYTWKPICLVKGFENQRQALQFEAAHKMKFQKCRNVNKEINAQLKNRGFHPRIVELLKVLHLEKWTSNAPPSVTIPLVIEWKGAHKPNLTEHDLPKHITTIDAIPAAT